MLEPPALSEADLLAGLREAFGLPIEALAFLPLGNDSAAWTYRARAAGRADWFVKLRREPRPAGILVPRFLHDRGLHEIVAARPVLDGRGWLTIGPWSVLVYPFIDDPNAMRVGMDLEAWRRLGDFVARLHRARLPEDLDALLPRERYRSKATAMARRVARRLGAMDAAGGHSDPTAEQLAAAWRTHARVIDRLVRRSDELARRIRDRPHRGGSTGFVICHADIHIGNVLIGPAGDLSVIDWDEVMLAPPERDLMFVRGSVTAGPVSDAEATAFEAGYGTAESDQLLIAWYRIDWAVQDIADFARRVVLDPDLGELSRANALRLFESNFEPGGQVEAAITADDRLPT